MEARRITQELLITEDVNLQNKFFLFKMIWKFNSFNFWAKTLKNENNKTTVLIGCEPTGHYWFAFAKYVKDPKTITKLVVDGRYSIPYIPEGIYAEIRDLVYSRDRVMKQHNISANRIQRWLAIHFPEYLGIYKI